MKLDSRELSTIFVNLPRTSRLSQFDDRQISSDQTEGVSKTGAVRQTLPTDVANGEESVEVVYCKTEHLRSTVLFLADLQHPVRHLLPHVRLQVRLHRREIVLAGRRMPHFTSD